MEKKNFSTTWLQIRILHTKTQLLFFKTWYICSNYFLTEHSFLISREVNFNTKLSFTLCTRWNATWINMHIYQGNCLKYKLMVNWHSNLQKIFENSSKIRASLSFKLNIKIIKFVRLKKNINIQRLVLYDSIMLCFEIFLRIQRILAKL